MKVVTLLENDTQDKNLKHAHGLSLYIEANNKKILFDIGPNNYYEKNAKKLNVDLDAVDFLVISHGHNDHGTGVQKFLKKHKKTVAYLSQKAFDDHVKQDGNNYVDIGIGKKPKSERLHTIYREKKEISPGVILYDKVDFKKLIIGDQNLLRYEDGRYTQDRFQHEIYMIVQEGLKNALFTGCSHRGIEEIVDAIEKDLHIKITHVFGGLHFSHYDSFNFKQTDYLIKLGNKLAETKNINVFACHCTGEDAYFELKKEMKQKMNRLKTGSVVTL
jgi:7,8-dihydropterin-6-yl-methyl-4-(beta-D-ribofuranosyl)aminobenzene 5'-phosphate synthase